MVNKLSIITICYNEPNLEETCESIVNQTWQDFEWIVIDGGSGEETQKIWDKYKYRINKFISEPDNGIYDACNKGIKLVTTDFFILMNAGDMFNNYDVLNCCKDFFNTDADVLYSCNHSFYRNKDEEWIYFVPKELSRKFFIKYNICTQSIFYRTQTFKDSGYYDETLKILSDYDKNLQLFQSGAKFKYLPVIISSYNSDGISSKRSTCLQKERMLVRRKYFSYNELSDYEQKYYETKKLKLSFFEQIFSITNSVLKIHKIITIFGIKIKLKRYKEIL